MKLRMLLVLLLTSLVAPLPMAGAATTTLDGSGAATTSYDATPATGTADSTAVSSSDATVSIDPASSAVDQTVSSSLTTSTLSTTSTTAFGTKKFRPGHYIALLRSLDSQSYMTASIKPGVVGIMKRYTWRSLEPTLGNYDFSQIQSDLYWAAAYGMKLIVMIEDKTFVFEKPGPGYLDQYEIRNRVGGFTLARWNSYVISRMNALTKALGNRFDSSNALEGVIIGEETAPSIDNTSLNANGYTAAKYRDAYISMLGSAAASFPTTRIFWYMNYFPGNQDYIGSVLTAVAPKGVVMGGPDVAPDDGSLKSMVYPYYTKFQGKMPLFGQVEGRCYAHEHKTSGYSTKYWTPPELFNYAKNNLHVNYMFWVRIPKPQFYNSYDWVDAHPTINYNSPFYP